MIDGSVPLVIPLTSTGMTSWCRSVRLLGREYYRCGTVLIAMRPV
jgi:hypothetical protein